MLTLSTHIWGMQVGCDVLDDVQHHYQSVSPFQSIVCNNAISYRARVLLP